MKQIPCIKNKCLKLPVCKNRSVINCTSLKEFYLNYFDDKAKILDESNKIWASIHKYLPSVTVIHAEATSPILFEHIPLFVISSKETNVS